MNHREPASAESSSNLKSLFFENLAVVIAAGGVGRRFSENKNKLFISIGSEPVFIKTLKNILEFTFPENIYLSINPQFEEQYLDNLQKYLQNESGRINIVHGGRTRMHSVYNALCRIPDSTEYTAVHDAARPFAGYEIFFNCLQAAGKYGSAVPAKKITDTLKRTDENNFIIENIDRENVWAVETPQIFPHHRLFEAYKSAFKKKLTSTDDAGIMEYSGYTPYILHNPLFNIKITFEEDISRTAYNQPASDKHTG